MNFKIQPLFIILCFSFLAATAQKDKFDLLSYTMPNGWSTAMNGDDRVLKIVNNQNKTWCQILLYKSIKSRGSVNADFASDWADYAVKTLKATTLQENEVLEENGWKYKAVGGKFRLNKADATIMHTTITGYGVTTAVIITTNSSEYADLIEEFMNSLELEKPSLQAVKTEKTAANKEQTPAAVSNGFKFNTTSFDDGWTSAVKEDWVEVSKGSVRVLVHYPNQKADEYRTSKQEADNNAWNVLVAHRYSNLSEFYDRGTQGMPSITFFTGNAKDNATGKKVHIVLYRKQDWNGAGKYIEVVADNQTAFEKEFGNNYIDPSSYNNYDRAESWNKIANMQNYNKFPLAASDLIGKWSSSEYASISYYYVNTGLHASTTATSLADKFTFFSGNKYESDHGGASGQVGNMKFSQQVYKGNSTVTNWEIILTNRFQGGTEKFSCHFEAVKGGRALIMTDRNNHRLFLVKAK